MITWLIIFFSMMFWRLHEKKSLRIAGIIIAIMAIGSLMLEVVVDGFKDYEELTLIEKMEKGVYILPADGPESPGMYMDVSPSAILSPGFDGQLIWVMADDRKEGFLLGYANGKLHKLNIPYSFFGGYNYYGK